MDPANLHILLPDGEHTLSPKVAFCLSQEHKVKIHCLSTDPSSPYRYSKFFHSYICNLTPGNSIEDRFTCLLQTIKTNNFDLIMPVWESGFELCTTYKSEIQKFCKIANVPDKESFQKVSRKDLFASFMVENNLPHPKTILFESLDQASALLADMKLPVLIKPVSGSGGKGIQAFADKENLLKYLIANEKTLKSKIIIQEKFEGKDVDVNVLCKENGSILAYTIQECLIPSDKPFEFARAIKFIQNDFIMSHVENLMTCLGWQGVAHVDLRYNEATGELVFLELNPRFWGSLHGSLRAGVNFPLLLVLDSLGMDYTVPEYEKVSFARINFQILKDICLRKYPLKLSETDFNYLVADLMPLLRSGIDTLRHRLTHRSSISTGTQG